MGKWVVCRMQSVLGALEQFDNLLSKGTSEDTLESYFSEKHWALVPRQ